MRAAPPFVLALALVPLVHAGAPARACTSDDVGHFGFGQEITRDRARDRPDWTVPVAQGCFESDVKLVPPLGL